MLLVKTIVGPSNIAGTGLFADEDIKKGTKIWVFRENFDRKFSKDEIIELPQITQEHIKMYAYLSKTTNLYIYPTDNARFLNSSAHPNIEVIFNEESEEDINIAARDIKKGEELTINYEKFDQEFPLYNDTYK